MSITGNIHHIEIYVNDLVQMKEFWSWFLEEMGYTLYQEWDEGFSYKLDKTYIVFVSCKKKYSEQKYNRCYPGLNHIAFSASNKEFIDNMYKKLHKRGVSFLYHDKFPYAGGESYYALFFEDPQRIKVEIVLHTD